MASLLCTGVVAAQPHATPTEEVPGIPFRVRASMGGALLVSEDQTDEWVLGYKGAGVQLDAQVGFTLRHWFQPHVGLLSGVYPSRSGGPGALLAPMVGVGIGAPANAHQVYALLEAGPGYTGERVRPTLRLGVGLDVRVSRVMTMGPQLGYVQVFRPKGPEADTTTGAHALYLALSFAFNRGRSAPPEPAPPVVVERVRTEREVLVVELPPPPQPPSEDLMQLLDRALPRTRVELLAPVLFQFDSAELEPVGVAMLHEVARELSRRQDIELVEVQGYADSRGSDGYNDELSRRRAERVVEWLVEHEVSPDRLRVAAHGGSHPVEEGDAEANYEQNRRVVFRVVPAEERDP